MDRQNCMDMGKSHQYDPASWQVKYIGEKCVAYRTCNQCGATMEFANGEDYLSQITEQNDATKLFNLFSHVDSNRSEIVGLLCTFLKLYLNYLNKDDREKLIIKMREIEKSPNISGENSYYINLLGNFIAENHIDVDFDTVLQEFYDYNFPNELQQTSQKGYTH